MPKQCLSYEHFDIESIPDPSNKFPLKVRNNRVNTLISESMAKVPGPVLCQKRGWWGLLFGMAWSMLPEMVNFQVVLKWSISRLF